VTAISHPFVAASLGGIPQRAQRPGEAGADERVETVEVDVFEYQWAQPGADLGGQAQPAGFQRFDRSVDIPRIPQNDA
jgi:hypothetical protein